MSDIAIRVENLGKQYKIGAQQERYKTLRETLVGAFTSPLRRILNSKSAVRNQDTIWALKDVSFEVKQGEVVGIIGRNGAGKSTLLKILAHITEPTDGRVRLRGRVGSLLEVGTGFHPELTGRENIYLNGAILGMKKAEIERKFDEIVAFAEIEKFLDTPVKHYSSGMYVRLAFAVAAHLEPEILLVDEVLAVGDAAFQKKCLGKMGEVAREGRTVLFVSHNMASIEALCSKAMTMSGGTNSFLGPTPEIIRKYLEAIVVDASIPLKDRKDRQGKGSIRFKEIQLSSDKGSSNTYTLGDDILVYVTVESSYPMDVNARLALSIRTASEIGLISCDSGLKGKTYPIPGASVSTWVCRIYSPPLNYGEYYINLAIFRGGEPEDWITSVAKFSIESGNFDGRVTTNPFPVLSSFEWGIERRVSLYTE